MYTPASQHAQPADDYLVFEQPLAERMRTFLRIEFLYQQSLYHAEMDAPWSSRAAIDSLLGIMAILTRGDVRGDVLKELERHTVELNRYQAKSGVDGGRLQSLLSNLGNLRDQLSGQQTHFLQSLKESDFLSAVKHRSAIPGGTCEFDLPDYNHWLHRDMQDRTRDFEKWMADLRPLCDGVAELLWLTRESVAAAELQAHAGMFQQALEKGSSVQMVRVAVPRSANVFPEISGSQQRFTVRFLEWQDTDHRPSQTQNDIDFRLYLC
jgi:cell division protein ZapD